MKPGNRHYCSGANSSRVNLKDERKAVPRTPRIPRGVVFVSGHHKTIITGKEFGNDLHQ
jgi:hypothetical protein